MEPLDGPAEAPLPAAPHGPEVVDAARITALRRALLAGALRTDTRLIAVRLLGWERLLGHS